MALVFCSLKTSASYRAGEITYRWLQGYTYEVKFTTYTTDNFPDNYCVVDSVCFGDGVNGRLLRSNGPCNGFCTPYCDGLSLAPGIKKNEYLTQHTYPGPGSYKFCFRQPNRNAGINNISNSIDVVFQLESYLVISTFSGPNNSPVFSNPPVVSDCLNNGCLMYNPGATDHDGDSLSYEVIPYTQMPGATLPGAGMSTFTVHPVTGTVSWCNPTWTGDYNFTLRVKEWQKASGNYSMAGYVDRDIQISMSVCAGVDGLEGSMQANLFPNPFTDVITLSVQNNKGPFTVKLYDITGRTLHTFLNDEPIGQTTSLELGGFGPGIYLLKISSSSGTVTKKIIKH